jgi:hypothetical protein
MNKGLEGEMLGMTSIVKKKKKKNPQVAILFD